MFSCSSPSATSLSRSELLAVPHHPLLRLVKALCATMCAGPRLSAHPPELLEYVTRTLKAVDAVRMELEAARAYEDNGVDFLEELEVLLGHLGGAIAATTCVSRR